MFKKNPPVYSSIHVQWLTALDCPITVIAYKSNKKNKIKYIYTWK